MISQNFVSSSSLNSYIWCSYQFRLGGLHSSLLIFSKLIWLMSLHVALKHTVISCPFFVSALKGTWLLSICTALWKCFLSQCRRIKYGFWFATCWAKLSAQMLLLHRESMFQNWWQVSLRDFFCVCICKCRYILSIM